jgi:hypothetical protein
MPEAHELTPTTTDYTRVEATIAALAAAETHRDEAVQGRSECEVASLGRLRRAEAAEARVKELEAARTDWRVVERAEKAEAERDALRTAAHAATESLGVLRDERDDARQDLKVAVELARNRMSLIGGFEAERDAARDEAASHFAAWQERGRAADEMAARLETERDAARAELREYLEVDVKNLAEANTRRLELDAARARSAQLEAALRDALEQLGHSDDDCETEGHQRLVAALAASPVEPAKCPHGMKSIDDCFDCMMPKKPVEPDDFAMRVAEAVREACSAWARQNIGKEAERDVDSIDLAAIVAEVRK